MKRRDFLKAAGSLVAAWALSDIAEGGTMPDRRPNILFFFPDQHRFDWIGSHPGMPIHTPNLTVLALRGMRFTNAICPSPICAPSRAALASGKEYDRCRVSGNDVDYPVDQTTVYSLLRDSGYHVMGCGKFDLHKSTPFWGLKGKRLLPEWGFSDGIDSAGKWDAIWSGEKAPKDPYMDYLEHRGLRLQHCEDFYKRLKGQMTHTTPLPDDAYCDNWIAENGLRLIDRAPAGKPWFLQINFTGPHDPWDITVNMEKSARRLDGFPPANGTDGLIPEQHLAVRQNYSAMVENIDRWLGKYMEVLRRRGELENTLIVYSSDHGEMLGDHDCWGKQIPFQPSVGVPLVIAGPHVQAKTVCTAPTATLDLTATFLDAASVPVSTDMDSRSLMPVLTGKRKSSREVVFSGLSKWRLAYDGRYKLVREFSKNPFGKVLPIRTDDEKVSLYDLESDPGENRDIAEEAPGHTARLMEHFRSYARFDGK